MELGSRPGPGDHQENDYLPHQIQGVHGARLERGAAVFDQKRQDRPLGHAQRVGTQKDFKKVSADSYNPRWPFSVQTTLIKTDFKERSHLLSSWIESQTEVKI